MEASPEQAVCAINGIYGRHPGCRAAHARGTICSGVFTPSAAAGKLTRARHMQAGSTEVTVRFSNAPGDPGVADGAPEARGMATGFHLPDGSRTDIVAVTLPCFFVRSPEAFIGLSRALRRTRERGNALLRAPRVTRFLLTHREAWKAVGAVSRLKPVPSYANCRYNALHAYKWIGHCGQERYVRYSWRPEAGEASISRRDGKGRERDYLQRDLYERLWRRPAQPIRFSLELRMASPEDIEKHRVCDPTAIWKGGKTIDAGILELTGLDERHEGALVFDPTRVTDGIELSDDEILRFRPGAYAVSYERRAGDGS